MSDVYRDGPHAAWRRMQGTRERALHIDDQLRPGAFASRPRDTAERLRELRLTCAALERDPRHLREAERLWAAYEDELRSLFRPPKPFDPIDAVAKTVVARYQQEGRARWSRALEQRDARALTRILRGFDVDTRIDWLDGTLMVAKQRSVAISSCVVAGRRGAQCVITLAVELARRAPWLSADEDPNATISSGASADEAFEQLFQITGAAQAREAIAGATTAAMLKLSVHDALPRLSIGDGIGSLRFVVAGAGAHRSKLDPELFAVVYRVLWALRDRWRPPDRAAPEKGDEKSYHRWPPPAASGRTRG